MGKAMLTIEQIHQYFPDPVLKRNPKGVWVEYLQYEILDSLFKNKEAGELSFIGGTAIRVIHESTRFSEDLDFDNFGLSFREFDTLLRRTCEDMKLKGFLVESRTVGRGAYHCYIRFPELLYKVGLSSNIEQKILIRVDAEHKERRYAPGYFLLNKFSVYQKIAVAPPGILLAQKMIAVLKRKPAKGRDLFDVSFLSGITKPAFDYAASCLSIREDEFKEQFSKRVDDLDLDFLAKDVEPFLFYPAEKKRILTFKDYFNQIGI